jgi:hypothetical protein
MQQIGKGNVPTSGMAAELAMKATQEKLDEESGTSEDAPFQMQPEKFDDGGGDFGPF